MSSFAPSHERPTLLELTRSAEYTARAFEVLRRIDAVTDPAEIVGVLALAVSRLGGDAAVFTTFLCEDETLSTYRSVLACDPLWGTEYARNGWFVDDPWLQYAMCHAEPVRASELRVEKTAERIVVDAAALYGFRSAVIVPAPTSAGQARVGMLAVGSNTAGYFDGDGYAAFRLVALSLAMELHAWWHRHIRQELVARARITEADLVLLRHEQAGHTSKVIAKALQIDARTIDSRFQRISAKLGAANRHAAVRLAKIYGLI